MAQCWPQVSSSHRVTYKPWKSNFDGKKEKCNGSWECGGLNSLLYGNWISESFSAVCWLIFHRATLHKHTSIFFLACMTSYTAHWEKKENFTSPKARWERRNACRKDLVDMLQQHKFIHLYNFDHESRYLNISGFLWHVHVVLFWSCTHGTEWHRSTNTAHHLNSSRIKKSPTELVQIF